MSEPALRRLAPDEAERCMALALRVGWPREPEKWQLLFTLGGVYAAGGEVLRAMVAIPAFEGASFVAMMVVDPDAQGRGLGRALLAHALAESTGPFMLYATPIGRLLYERLDFREVHRATKHVGPPRPTRAAPGVRAARPDDADAIIAEDARGFGVRRSRLLSQLLARAERAVVGEGGGFAIRWRSGEVAVVGPIVAESEDAAIALLEGALEGCGTAARVDVPAGSERFAAHVRSLGLAEIDTAPLMTCPGGFYPGDPSRYYALALQAFG
jgi:ribosomal protein S18 acetylase RimI-like enzyme